MTLSCQVLGEAGVPRVGNLPKRGGKNVAWLHVLRGPGSGTRVALEREHTVIGRGPDCDLAVPLLAVCREHARLSRVGEQFVIEDLNSRGGTWVNDRPARGPTPLRDGDRLRICDFMAVFEAERHSAEGQADLGQA
jgi:pSer/pThr/pTyr-binding forkhead associated (FHA) protein